MKNTTEFLTVTVTLLSLVALAAVGFAKMGVPAENRLIVFMLGFTVSSVATVFFNLMDKELKS